jgi:hypothetical protein
VYCFFITKTQPWTEHNSSTADLQMPANTGQPQNGNKQQQRVRHGGM